MLRQVKNNSGKLLVTNFKILERWRKHFEEISALEFDHPPMPFVPAAAYDAFLPLFAKRLLLQLEDEKQKSGRRG